MRESELRSMPLFASLSKEDLGKLARYTDQVDVPEGKPLARQGEFAYEFFAIREGSAEVTKDGQKIADLGPGDFFGEIGLLVTGRRTASVVAVSPMRLIAVFDRSFRIMERELPTFAGSVRAARAERFPRV